MLSFILLPHNLSLDCSLTIVHTDTSLSMPDAMKSGSGYVEKREENTARLACTLFLTVDLELDHDGGTGGVCVCECCLYHAANQWINKKKAAFYSSSSSDN